MKLYIALLAFLMPSLLCANDRTKSDSVRTSYKSGQYTSSAVAYTQCSLQEADKVVEDLISQFQGDPERLFDWAFKGLGEQGGQSQRDEVLLVFKATTFDKMTGISCLLVDVIVSGTTLYKDVEIKSKVVKEQLPDGTIKVSVDIYYSNALLKKASGTFFVIPLAADRVQQKMVISVRFGWFFNLFITQKRYKSIIEWRLDGFVDNIRRESERRHTKSLKSR
ncbi:MAG: hypothetical protein LBS16_01680 [Prevotellaceae bacterium]|jgi:hypothetical protein|nr:hypothetical protein [Prevotellaceae bacterium]